MLSKRYILYLTILLWICPLLSTEKSVVIKITEDGTIQETIDLLINAKALGFGKYGTSGDLRYLVNATDATISFSQDKIDFDIELKFSADVSYWPLTLSTNKTITLKLGSGVNVIYDQGSYKVVLDNIYVDDFDISDFPDFIEDSFSGWFNLYTALVLDEITLVTIPNPFPEIDPNLFETTAPLFEITDDAIEIYLTVQSMTILANKDINAPDDYLSGYLSLYNTSNSTLNKLNKPSPTTVAVKEGDTYYAKTHDIEISDIFHKTWTEDLDHKLVTTPFEMQSLYVEKNIIAYFDEKESINISVYPAGLTGEVIQYHDPWYYDSQTQSQPDCYNPITPGSYSVFLNQNPDFSSVKPIYSLKAPMAYATTSNIYVFDHWMSSADDEAVFDEEDAISTSLRETEVVFKSSDAIVTAYYTAVNQTNYTLTIPSDETLTIPPGATTQFHSGFTFDVDGTLEIEGTPAQPITLYSSGCSGTSPYNYWTLFDPTDILINAENANANLSVKNAVIHDTYCGISVKASNENVIIRNVEIYNTNIGIEIKDLTNAAVVFDSVYIHDSDIGIAADNIYPDTNQKSQLVLMHSIFADNDDCDLYLIPNNQITTASKVYVSINNCTFYNSEYALFIATPSTSSYGLAYTDIFNTIFSETRVRFEYNYSVRYDDYNVAYNTYIFGNFSPNSTSNPNLIDPANGDFRLTSSSTNCIDGGDEVEIPYYYTDPNYFEYEQEYDPDGTDIDIGALYYPQLTKSGTVSTNQSWYGLITVTNDVSVSSGINLTIQPGTGVFFADDTQINVYGTLIAEGTESYPIVFSSVINAAENNCVI